MHMQSSQNVSTQEGEASRKLEPPRPTTAQVSPQVPTEKEKAKGWRENVLKRRARDAASRGASMPMHTQNSQKVSTQEREASRKLEPPRPTTAQVVSQSPSSEEICQQCASTMAICVCDNA